MVTVCWVPIAVPAAVAADKITVSASSSTSSEIVVMVVVAEFAPLAISSDSDAMV